MSAFQSTRPLRGATSRLWSLAGPACISIHAPLAGRDWCRRDCGRSRWNFNPRAPCGARLTCGGIGGAAIDFNPRAPCGARRLQCRVPKKKSHFNPRAPCGARQQKCTNCFAHFCDNRQVLSKFAQNAACQGILIPFPFRKSLQIWVRTARAISARLRFAL